jgi:hypothetical protein
MDDMRLFRVTLACGVALLSGLAGLAATVTARDAGSPAVPERPAQAARPPIPVQVFFSRRSTSDDDFTAVFPVARTAPDLGVARFALQSLIAGPTPDELRAGYFSDLGGMLEGPSTCGGPDFTVAIQNGTATVQFCRLVSSAGVGQDARTGAQIEATLRQFPTVQRVRLLTSDGHCLFDQSGLDLCLRE